MDPKKRLLTLKGINDVTANLACHGDIIAGHLNSDDSALGALPKGASLFGRKIKSLYSRLRY